MRKFYHQDKIEIIENEVEQEYIFDLDIPNTYGFNYYQALDVTIKEFFSRLEDSNEATLFKIRGNFNLLEDADEEEKIYFIVAVVSIFVGHMIKEERLDREARLAPPKSIDALKLSLMTKKGIVNNLIKFPIFSIEVIDTDNNTVYEVFEDESISINVN